MADAGSPQQLTLFERSVYAVLLRSREVNGSSAWMSVLETYLALPSDDPTQSLYGALVHLAQMGLIDRLGYRHGEGETALRYRARVPVPFLEQFAPRPSR